MVEDGIMEFVKKADPFASALSRFLVCYESERAVRRGKLNAVLSSLPAWTFEIFLM